MGNTSSKGKKSGAIERVYTTKPSIQEERAPRDDEAAEAASQAIVNEEKPSLLGMSVELLDMVGKHLTPQDRKELAAVNRSMHSVFSTSNLHAKFIEYVAYGQQENAEKLLSQMFKGKPARIQAALLHQGTFTTYAGETFNCSAYEYAYWAKDTHMCRMLERYMDDETKSQMLTRIDAIESQGLAFQQNGESHRSAHFDFTPLKEAYQRYLARYDARFAAQYRPVIDDAWWDVGKAQRNVPAHVAQEYCRPDRAFYPRPEFNEATLPRRLTFMTGGITDGITDRDDSWFPLVASNSGLGFDFALIRGLYGCAVRAPRGWTASVCAGLDLAAITRLDEVRTVDLAQSREHLNPPAMSQSMSV